jgi:hypothetical protein
MIKIMPSIAVGDAVRPTSGVHGTPTGVVAAVHPYSHRANWVSLGGAIIEFPSTWGMESAWRVDLEFREELEVR